MVKQGQMGALRFEHAVQQQLHGFNTVHNWIVRMQVGGIRGTLPHAGKELQSYAPAHDSVRADVRDSIKKRQTYRS